MKLREGTFGKVEVYIFKCICSVAVLYYSQLNDACVYNPLPQNMVVSLS